MLHDISILHTDGGWAMKQRKLVSKLYRACIDHDEKTIQELRMQEFQKIAKRRAEGKSFTTQWTLVRI
jgi:hypothetical protein